jgi:hypothetical protein
LNKASHCNKWRNRQYIQDEDADSEQGRHKDREVDEGEQEIRSQVNKLISIFEG